MNTVRLIDANALKEEVNKKNVVGRYNTLLLLINNAPTIQERTTGEWKERYGLYFCSECGQIIGEYKKNYCPTCGADMRRSKNA